MIEFSLIFVIAVLSYQLFQTHKRKEALSFIFISHAQWCWDRLNNLSETSIDQITQLQSEVMQARGTITTPEECLGDVHIDILSIKDDLSEKQQQLRRSLNDIGAS